MLGASPPTPRIPPLDGLARDGDSTEESLDPKISSMMTPREQEPVNLALAKSAPGNPEA
uniref:Uncharacterized protein n=1 Tax=Peronospora matthiolae TaxID=2874970 RepID=A0AAV1TZV7_9STRA